MEHDDQTFGRILSRREALILTATTGLFGGLRNLGMGQATSPADLVASPQLTEGPFFVDEKLNRSDLIAGSSREAVAKGVPLELAFSLVRLDGVSHKPLAGAQVDVWHCDASGVYSDESNPMNGEDTASQKWLRGYQVSGANGQVTFKTIVPGWYESRAPHIHFKIRTYSAGHQEIAEFTSQLFFEEADLMPIYAIAPYQGKPHCPNEFDDIFMERQHDGTTAGSHLTVNLQKTGSGYRAKFVVALTDANLSASGMRRGGAPRGF